MIDLDVGTWTFDKHKTAERTGKPRVVYLTPAMVDLCRRLVAENPEGPIFLNTKGRSWNRNSIRCRFRNIRAKLKLDDGVVAYALRHTYITDGLANGVPIADMAELVGHASTEMISKHYSHLNQKIEHLRNAACRATAQAS